MLVGGGLYAVLSPTTYTVTSVFAVTPRNGSTASADVVRLLASSYVPYLTSGEVGDEVAVATGRPVATIADASVVSVDPGTADVRTVTTLPDPREAAEIANRLAEAGVTRAAQESLVTGDLVAPADPASAVASPPRTLILTSAALAAVIVAVVAWIGLARRQRRPF